MQFLFSLLRIKGLYMFRALLAHLQEAFHKWHLVYSVRVLLLNLASDCRRQQRCTLKCCSYILLDRNCKAVTADKTCDPCEMQGSNKELLKFNVSLTVH